MNLQQKAALEAETDVNLNKQRGWRPTLTQEDAYFTECLAYHLAWIYRRQRRLVLRTAPARVQHYLKRFPQEQ